MLFDDFYCLSIQRNKIGFFFQEDLYEKKKTATSNSDFISHFFKNTLEIRSSDITIACLYLVILTFSSKL